MLLDVVYIPPIVKLFGGREFARQVLRDCITNTSLETKVRIINLLRQAQDQLLSRFVKLWIDKATGEEYAYLENVLSGQGMFLKVKKPE